MRALVLAAREENGTICSDARAGWRLFELREQIDRRAPAATPAARNQCCGGAAERICLSRVRDVGGEVGGAPSVSTTAAAAAQPLSAVSQRRRAVE